MRLLRLVALTLATVYGLRLYVAWVRARLAELDESVARLADLVPPGQRYRSDDALAVLDVELSGPAANRSHGYVPGLRVVRDQRD